MVVKSVWPDQWAEALVPYVILRLTAGGSSIAQVVRAVESSGVAPGRGGATLAALNRLEDDALIRFSGETEVSITTEGERMLAQWDSRWEQFVTLVNAAVR